MEEYDIMKFVKVKSSNLLRLGNLSLLKVNFVLVR